MNFDVASRTILLVRHGSHAYGMNTLASDLDSKGVCIEPKKFHFGFLHTFEQETREARKGAPEDRVVYSLKKFAGLAAECNPNIIEVLHVADEHVLSIDAFGEELRGMRDMFISAKARWTFAGYAHSQLKRIKTHRKWLLEPPKAPPTRASFGLSEVSKVSKSELGAFDSLMGGVKGERCDECDPSFGCFDGTAPCSKRAGPSALEVEIPKELMTLFTREKQYQAAKTQFDQYMHWKKTRNPARAELEAKFGLDTKHAAHLVRLLRMCKEIMMTGKVVVKRPDAAELLSIRAGAWTYDQIVEYAERTEAECAALYDAGTTVRHEPDRVVIDAAIVGMTERYLAAHG
jgi:predicted nucleotidyltransferase